MFWNSGDARFREAASVAGAGRSSRALKR